MSKSRAKTGKSLEDIRNEQDRSESLPADVVGMMSNFMRMALSSSSNPMALKMKSVMEIYERSPNLASEFEPYLKARRGIPIQPVMALLNEVTKLNKGLYMQEMSFYLESESHPMLDSPKTIFKILNSCDERKIDWLFDPTSPLVNQNECADAYEESIFHSFSNCKARTEKFETGKTHIAVGFVDLSIPLQMDIDPSEGADPFHFIGYECSAYSIAKTLIISVMLKNNQHDSDVVVDAILQVWYSSCWNHATLELFRVAANEAKSLSTHEAVSELLDLWAGAEAPPLKEAREKWLEKIDVTLFDPAINCLKSKNRKILTQYFLTGQLLLASVGSMTMFQLPQSYVGRSRNESCFHSIGITALTQSANNCGGDFVAGAISILREKIGLLKHRIARNLVKISIVGHPAMVSLSNPKVIKEIRLRCPYSISWNNCLDYMSIKDFHRLARACSAPKDTVHYGYSMNWPCNVKGASSLTYATGKHMEELMKVIRQQLQHQYDLIGLKDLMILPPIDNAINLLDYCYSQGLWKEWIRVFFESVRNVAQVEPSLFSVFARTNNTVFFTWSYDDEVQFKPLHLNY